MTYQIYVFSAQKCSCLRRCVRACIVVVKSYPSSAVGFPEFLEIKEIVVYHSELTVLRCSSGTITTCPVFPKKTGDPLLGSASCASNYCWIWLILKHPYSRLLFTFGLISVNPRFITSRNVVDVFRSTAIVFLMHFFRPNDTSLLLSN